MLDMADKQPEDKPWGSENNIRPYSACARIELK